MPMAILAHAAALRAATLPNEVRLAALRFVAILNVARVARVLLIMIRRMLGPGEIRHRQHTTRRERGTLVDTLDTAFKPP